MTVISGHCAVVTISEEAPHIIVDHLHNAKVNHESPEKAMDLYKLQTGADPERSLEA